MANKIAQLRFSEDSQLNFKNGWSNNLLTDLGDVFRLGIYALPGTQFKINQENASSIETLIIGSSGFFNIETEKYPITNIQLSQTSYNNIINID